MNPVVDLSLTSGVSDYAVSPYGKRAVLVVRGDLFLIPERGGTTRRLTKSPAVDFQPVWLDPKTILFVTHNVREVLVLGDRVVLMSARLGRVKREVRCQLPRPRQIEDHALVDLARDLLVDLRAEVMAARAEVEHVRLAR